MGRFKTLVEDCGTFKKVLSSIPEAFQKVFDIIQMVLEASGNLKVLFEGLRHL